MTNKYVKDRSNVKSSNVKSIEENKSFPAVYLFFPGPKDGPDTGDC